MFRKMHRIPLSNMVNQLETQLLDEEHDSKNDKLAQTWIKDYLDATAVQLNLKQWAMEKVHAYKDGDFFGDLALHTEKKRQATLSTIKECHFATISKVDFKKLIDRFEQRRVQTNFELLEQLPYFSHWSKNMLRKVQPCFNVVEVTRGQILIQEGSLCENIYIVRKGSFSGFKSYKINVKPSKFQQKETAK